MMAGARLTGARGWLAGAVGAAVSIAGVAAVSRIVGLGRTVTFARTVGATCLGDTYVTSNTVPNIIFEIVAGGALASLVVPVLAGPVVRGDRAEVSQTTSALLSWALLIAAPVTALGAVFARPLIGLLIGATSRGCDRHVELVVGARMLLVFMPQVVLYALAVVLTGVLQAHRRFLAPAAAPLVSSVVVIGAYLLFHSLHGSGADIGQVSLSAELVLSVGTTLGVAALVAPMLFPAAKLGLRLRPTLRFPRSVGRRVAGLAAAGALTLAAQQLSVAVVLRLAHRGDAGALVLYNLAWAVYLVPWSVVAVPIATSAFPRLAARGDSGDQAGYAAAASLGLRIVTVATAAAAAGLVVTSAPAARVLVLRVPGNGDTTALAWTLAAFAPGLLGYGLVAYLGRALYALQRWRFAAAAICGGWVVVIAADLALVPAFDARWRVVALAIGNSIGMTVAGLALLVGVARATRRRVLSGMARTAAGSLAGVIAGLAVGLAVVWLLGPHSAGVSVFVALVAGAVAIAVAVLVTMVVEPASERARLRSQLFGPLRLRGGESVG
ncbi:MAG TPA: lipid II flippase MurJ [Acidothermaceae bacterium]